MSAIFGPILGVTGFACTGYLITELFLFFGNQPDFVPAAVKNLSMGKTVDGTVADRAKHTDLISTALWNVAVFMPFILQHIVMARPWFKKLMPSQRCERSVYVILACVALEYALLEWKPMPQSLFTIPANVALAIYIVGWLVLFAGCFSLDFFELFGVKQGVFGKFNKLEFKECGLYKCMRHPIMTGFLLIVWGAHDFTIGRVLVASLLTAFIVFTVSVFEEPLLVKDLGQQYKNYQKRVPAYFPCPFSMCCGKSNKK